jgi:hypothetical protein
VVAHWRRVKEAMTRVETSSLTAKEILRKIFHAKSNKKILHKVSSRMRGIRVNSFTSDAFLISYRAGKFLKGFWRDFQSLRAEDRRDVAHVIAAKLMESPEFRGTKKGGRPRGATKDTNWRIAIAAALSVLGCSEAGMLQYLYPGFYSDHSNASGIDCLSLGRGKMCKFLERNAVAINHQRAGMTRDLAIRIVRGSITKRSA